MSGLEVMMMKRIGELNEEVKLLQAENERLRKFNDEALAHIAKEERKSRERLDIVQADVERLIKAGDAVALDYAERIEIEAGDSVKNLMRKLPVLREWNAAKEDASL